MTDQVEPSPAVEVDQQGPVLRLKLDRAEKRNAIDDSMMAALIDAIDGAGRDESVRVIVISGEGDHFCSGADIVARNTASAERPRVGSIQRRLPAQANRLIPLIVNTQTPVVCVAHGWTAGIGLNIALAADVCLAATDARFWAPFVGRGFTPDSGATWLLPRRIGEVRAREMLLMGRVVSGEEAAEWGMVHRAVRADELADVADEVVDGAGGLGHGGARSDQVADAQRLVAAARTAPARRGVRDGAVVAERGLPRRHVGVP